ncbi:MAG TPA: OsmC family protein [Thermomicrobiales bacterium]|nr:OsmC family protein [Thermomicrobiales bacterium]
MAAPGRVHRYTARCNWTGSTANGYERYTRDHTAAASPARGALTISADPAFHGDAEYLNPEQLLVIAAASCQLLSFLALAARSRITVLSYEDDAEGEMPEDNHPTRIATIRLRPQITVASGTDHARALRLVERAHQECYVANSLTSTITIEPAIVST